MSSPTYRAVGRSFTVELPDGHVADHVEAALVDLRSSTSDGPVLRYWIRPTADGWYAVGREEETLRPTTNLDGAFGTLLWDVNQQAVRSAGTDDLVIHAGAVATAHAGVLLPGVSGAGKSSVTAGLVRRGLDYLSDELAIVAPDTLTMRAYAKPITLEAGGGSNFPDLVSVKPPLMEVHLPATRLRAGSLVATAPVSAVVFPTFRAEGPTELTRLSPSVSLGHLAASMMRPRDGSVLPQLAELVGRCRCFALTYADLSAACDLVIAALEEDM